MPANRIRLAIAVVALFASLGLALFTVDLAPRVDRDFFFATDDPALQSSRAIQDLFPTPSPFIVAAQSSNPLAPESVERVRQLTDELAKLPRLRVLSLTSGPDAPDVVATSPLWSRILLGHQGTSSYLLLEPLDLDTAPRPSPSEPSRLEAIERIVANHQDSELQLALSGVPYVVEQIRRALERDLRVFSLTTLTLFGLMIFWVYRSLWLVAGTLLTCATACLITLVSLAAFEVPIGLLTANIVTIVFVLTLSHTVFLTSNWRRIASRVDRAQQMVDAADASTAVTTAVRVTWPASFWCMTAALLGFGSLLLAHARPLRELGVSGLCGTVAALVAAYSLYPAFLSGQPLETPCRNPAPQANHPPRIWVWSTLVLCGMVGFGVRQLDTDPTLLSYFDRSEELYRGLATIDADLGSSPLLLLLSDATGTTLDRADAGRRLRTLQEELDEDPAVGTVLSIAVIADEARQNPLARLLSWRRLLELLESERSNQIARRFLSEDRRQTLFALSMHEAEREVDRAQIVGRLRARIDAHGFQTDRVGGLYDLQRQLGELVATSLFRELSTLLFCFFGVAWIVSRRLRSALAMVVTLAAIPLLLLGTLGRIGYPLDVISSPAVNVAIALGIDAMIHLAAAVRRLRGAGIQRAQLWSQAIAQQRPAILGAMSILATGFALFLLSSFPPTRLFGGLVAAGMLLSAGLALKVLPALAGPES